MTYPLTPEETERKRRHDAGYEAWVDGHKKRGTWGLVLDACAHVRKYGWNPPLKSYSKLHPNKKEA